MCIAGHRLFKIVQAVLGFAVGFLVGMIITEITGDGSTIMWIILGLLGAFLAHKLYLVGLFLNSMTLSFFVFVMIFSVVVDSMDTALNMASVSSLVWAILTVVLNKPLIILQTAFGGAFIIALCIARSSTLLLLITIVLGSLGVIAQYRPDKVKEMKVPDGVKQAFSLFLALVVKLFGNLIEFIKTSEFLKDLKNKIIAKFNELKQKSSTARTNNNNTDNTSNSIIDEKPAELQEVNSTIQENTKPRFDPQTGEKLE